MPASGSLLARFLLPICDPSRIATLCPDESFKSSLCLEPKSHTCRFRLTRVQGAVATLFMFLVVRLIPAQCPVKLHALHRAIELPENVAVFRIPFFEHKRRHRPYFDELERTGREKRRGGYATFRWRLDATSFTSSTNPSTSRNLIASVFTRFEFEEVSLEGRVDSSQCRILGSSAQLMAIESN